MHMLVEYAYTDGHWVFSGVGWRVGNSEFIKEETTILLRPVLVPHD